MTALQSSNPILGDTNLGPVVSQVADRNDVATVSGVINRTTLLVGAAVVSGAVAFSLVQPGPAVWVINLVAFGVTLAVFFAIRGKAFVHPGIWSFSFISWTRSSRRAGTRSTPTPTSS